MEWTEFFFEITQIVYHVQPRFGNNFKKIGLPRFDVNIYINIYAASFWCKNVNRHLYNLVLMQKCKQTFIQPRADVKM